MKKLVYMPDQMAKDIEAVAAANKWRFSRTMCYLVYVGQSHLARTKQAPEPLYTFDVDHPTRRARNQPSDTHQA